jgi:predicted nucleic acid binding AN1-type Zn finger protein
MEDLASVETVETVDTLRLRVQALEAENAAMRPIVRRMAEARMCRDSVTMIESCPHCSLKRGGEYGYVGKHDDTCMVTHARQLGL